MKTAEYAAQAEEMRRDGCYTKHRMMSGPRKAPSAFLLVLAILACRGFLYAQSPSVPSIPAGQLVREAVANEVAAANAPPIRHMFRARTETPKGSQTKLYVETKDAIAAMLIAVNDHPLTAQQKQGEINHLNWLSGSPEALRRKRAREKEDADRTVRIVKALPDAFVYEYAGSETGDATMGRVGSQLMRLKFRPNPQYSPPSRVEQALEGMNGFLLIDLQSKRLARIDGTLFRDVSFGWGIIGHLDKGGHFVVRQADVGDGDWEITEMQLNITGKILLFKSISMVSDEVVSDFRRVPEELTFAQGVEMLEKEQQKVEEAGATRDKK